jgi:hypothetical protein
VPDTFELQRDWREEPGAFKKEESCFVHKMREKTATEKL